VLNPHFAHHGFSLIELAIGMVIVGILTAAAVPSFRNWMQSSQIRNTTESILNGLQLARVEAVRRNASVQFVFGAGSDWTVGCLNPVDLNGDGVEDPGDCPAIIQSRFGAEGTPNASVTVTPAGTSAIIFNGLGRAPAGAVDIDVANPTGGTCIAASGSMRCLRVITSVGGQVHMCDPAFTLSSTHPQGC